MVKLTESLVLGKARVDSLLNVKNLNVWGNSLSDISVIQNMPNIEVASLSVNCIDSLKDFTNCQKLQELYLRKNQISDLSEIAYLKNLKHLRVLWLNGNPCSETENYRLKVICVLDQLDKLDDDDISPDEKMRAALFSSGELDIGQELNKHGERNVKDESPPVNSPPIQQPQTQQQTQYKPPPTESSVLPIANQPKRALHRDDTPLVRNQNVPSAIPSHKQQIHIPRHHDESDDEEYDEDTDSYSVQQHNPRGIGVLNRGVDKPQLPSKVQPSVQHQRAHSYQQPSMLDERHGQPPIPNQYYNEQPNYSNGISLHNPYQEEPSYISVKQSQQMPYMQQQNRMNNRASNSHQYPYNAPNNNYNPQQRMIPNRNNILTAVLSLLQELDPERLRIIKQECDKLTMYQ